MNYTSCKRHKWNTLPPSGQRPTSRLSDVPHSTMCRSRASRLNRNMRYLMSSAAGHLPGGGRREAGGGRHQTGHQTFWHSDQTGQQTAELPGSFLRARAESVLISRSKDSARHVHISDRHGGGAERIDRTWVTYFCTQLNPS